MSGIIAVIVLVFIVGSALYVFKLLGDSIGWPFKDDDNEY